MALLEDETERPLGRSVPQMEYSFPFRLASPRHGWLSGCILVIEARRLKFPG
jgi:hypothetical protein